MAPVEFAHPATASPLPSLAHLYPLHLIPFLGTALLLGPMAAVVLAGPAAEELLSVGPAALEIAAGILGTEGLPLLLVAEGPPQLLVVGALVEELLVGDLVELLLTLSALPTVAATCETTELLFPFVLLPAPLVDRVFRPVKELSRGKTT